MCMYLCVLQNRTSDASAMVCVSMSIGKMGVELKVVFGEWENSSKSSNSKIVHLAVPPAHFFITFFLIHFIWFVSNRLKTVSSHLISYHFSIVCHIHTQNETEMNRRYPKMENLIQQSPAIHTVIAIKIIAPNWYVYFWKSYLCRF